MAVTGIPNAGVDAVLGLGGVQPSQAGASSVVAPASAPASAPAEAFGLHFSKHAARRIEQRGLALDEGRMERLERAVDQAEAKGAKDSLILLDELALVVSVQNRTVVTAVDEANRKEHVFTNIDSVVIAQ
ncbi:MAG: TIGR02530 family flagellar biosynthesis protein [Dehalococcoidia bacterium]